MTREQALDKVKKLLRLANSSNAHEAGIALGQAQKMMASFGINDWEADGSNEATPWMRGSNPAIAEQQLSSIVAMTFACCHIIIVDGGRHQYVFVGGACTVAVYAYVVLVRQLRRDRTVYLRRVRIRKNRAARGDSFGLAWVNVAQRVLGEFQPVPEQVVLAFNRLFPDREKSQAKVRESQAARARFHADAEAGYRAGGRAQLNRGVASSTAEIEHKP